MATALSSQFAFELCGRRLRSRLSLDFRTSDKPALGGLVSSFPLNLLTRTAGSLMEEPGALLADVLMRAVPGLLAYTEQGEHVMAGGRAFARKCMKLRTR